MKFGFKNLRKCEYDESTYEYWVNTRTEGSLKREDVERLSRKREFEQEADAQDCMPSMDFSVGGFMDDLGTPGDLQLEGDANKSVARTHAVLTCMYGCIVTQKRNTLETSTLSNLGPVFRLHVVHLRLQPGSLIC